MKIKCQDVCTVVIGLGCKYKLKRHELHRSS
jgi:hypothetical protein